MSMADEIDKLHDLKKKGAISEEEYLKAKNDLLLKNQPAAHGDFSEKVKKFSSDVNAWSMLIHLSQFCGFIIPFAGMVVPIILWQVKKDESEVIDAHGKNVTNWIITELIAGLVFVLLSFIFIGIPLLIALAVIGIIFPILGGLKANKGEVWSYPLAIKFFK